MATFILNCLYTIVFDSNAKNFNPIVSSRDHFVQCNRGPCVCVSGTLMLLPWLGNSNSWNCLSLI